MAEAIAKGTSLFKSKFIIILVIVVVLGLCILCASVSINFYNNNFSSTGKTVKVTETNSGHTKITQAYVSISAFGANSAGDSIPDKAVIQYAPLVNITTKKEMSKFEIVNVKLTNPIKAEKTFITWPKHYAYGQDSNTFYEPMSTAENYLGRSDEGTSFEYKVVDNAKFADEISKMGGYVDFKYTIYGIGNKIDYYGIMNGEGIYSGGKELQYAGIKQGEINSPIEFDVVVTFKDKSQAIKHFSLTADFTEIYNEGFSFNYNSSDYVGKEF